MWRNAGISIKKTSDSYRIVLCNNFGNFLFAFERLPCVEEPTWLRARFPFFRNVCHKGTRFPFFTNPTHRQAPRKWKSSNPFSRDYRKQMRKNVYIYARDYKRSLQTNVFVNFDRKFVVFVSSPSALCEAKLEQTAKLMNVHKKLSFSLRNSRTNSKHVEWGCRMCWNRFSRIKISSTK